MASGALVGVNLPDDYIGSEAPVATRGESEDVRVKQARKGDLNTLQLPIYEAMRVARWHVGEWRWPMLPTGRDQRLRETFMLHHGLHALCLGLVFWSSPALADCARLRASYRIDWNTHTVLTVGANRNESCVLDTNFVHTGAGTANYIESITITSAPRQGRAGVEGASIRYTPRTGFTDIDESSKRVPGQQFGRPAVATATARFDVR